jgi:putative FmdB family regulatory protein
MPTYEYACKACGHRFEVVQSMRDDALTACPECGRELRKVFAPPAIAFKGSGFYATDHGKRPPTSSETGEGKSEGTKGEGKGRKPKADEGGGDNKDNERNTSTSGTPRPSGEAGSSPGPVEKKETTPT